MTKKTTPASTSFVSAAYTTPPNTPRARTSNGAPPRKRKVRAAEFVRMEDILFVEMESNNLAQAFSGEEIERMARLFGLSADEVAALYGTEVA
jgi:hypothetical protein